MGQGFVLDTIFTSMFYHWSTRPLPTRQSQLINLSSAQTLTQLNNLYRSVDLSNVPDTYPLARTMRRKIIMHVGPTNSGKTYHALRALAAAPVGAYAGPLRLLAHEIYERLNTGQIVPQGMDPEPALPDENSNLDVPPPDQTKPAIRKIGDERYIRKCSMVTGEEVRLVADANIYACTIEMLALEKRYDVVVLDEIQMIADSERGQGWTAAVLGVPAEELHL